MINSRDLKDVQPKYPRQVKKMSSSLKVLIINLFSLRLQTAQTGWCSRCTDLSSSEISSNSVKGVRSTGNGLEVDLTNRNRFALTNSSFYSDQGKLFPAKLNQLSTVGKPGCEFGN